MRSNKFSLISLPTVLFLLSAFPVLAQTTVCSGVPTTITSAGLTAPYPNTISVTSPITSATGFHVTLTGLTHTFPEDLEMLLIGPGGQKFVIFAGVGGGADAVAVNLVIRDDTTTNYPLLPDTTALMAGTYNPTDYLGGHDFSASVPPAPAAAPPYLLPQTSGAATFASVFNNTNPNGTWSLYILDAVLQDEGTLVDWCISFSSPSAASASISGRIVDKNGTPLGKTRVYLTGGDPDLNLMSITNPFGYYSFPDVPTGATYILTPQRKRWLFTPASRVFMHDGVNSDVDFTGVPDF